MDVDVVKTSASDSSNMDMMAMMMQMQKFPEFCEPFYTTPTYTQNELPCTGTSSTIFNNVPPLTSIDTPSSSGINFINNNNLIIQQPITSPLQPPHTTLSFSSSPPSSSEKKNSMSAMREMIFRIAVMQPIHIDPESVKPPKRRNVKISKDPQSVAARHRRERISERIRILQRLVPGGTKMDTASMLDEAIHYVKFLKKQVQTLEQAGAAATTTTRAQNVGIGNCSGFPSGMGNANVNSYSAFFMKGCQPCQILGGPTSSKQLLS
ncbi:hypothetical protein VNO77_25277 [Canavalia gladiata]|uniref:BHLH domain-containing protein n=1 Tax=Canavalia gladiata TaxID=3824 RepID=A0AAN9L8F3_CANGL